MPRAIQTILAATDLSPASHAATTYALQLAQALGAHLTLLHVIPEEDLHLIRSISQHLQSVLPDTALTEVLYREAERQMTQVLAAAQTMDPAPEPCIVAGNPAVVLLQWATEHHADLVILGTHGRRGLAHFMMGSVVSQVLQQAPCGVLVVPSTAQAVAASGAAAGSVSAP